MSRKIFIVAIFTFFNSLALSAQEADIILSRFIATQLEEDVFLRWTITAGNTCQDTYVERSTSADSGYERIGLIGGICGSPFESITYEFYDTMPLPNRTVYYRLQLGQYGFTSVKAVEFIAYNDQGYLLAPNPFTDQARIAFPNDDKSDHALLLFNIQGVKVMEMSTTGNQFIIRREDLAAGVYFFRIKKTGETLYSGKIVAN